MGAVREREIDTQRAVGRRQTDESASSSVVTSPVVSEETRVAVQRLLAAFAVRIAEAPPGKKRRVFEGYLHCIGQYFTANETVLHMSDPMYGATDAGNVTSVFNWMLRHLEPAGATERYHTDSLQAAARRAAERYPTDSLSRDRKAGSSSSSSQP